MNKIIEYIKKIWSVGVITLIVTIVFGYDQFVKNQSGEVTPVFYNIEDEGTHKDILIIKTNDSIILNSPYFSQSFKNTSKYALENVVIDVTMKCKPVNGYDTRFTPNDSYKMTYEGLEGSQVCRTFQYKTELLYPNEMSPNFFKQLTFLPQAEKDSFFVSFLVETKIAWNGHKSEKYTTNICFKTVLDDNKIDSLYEDSTRIFGWLHKVSNALKGKVTFNKFNYCFAFHSIQDSLKRQGSTAYFHDIVATDIDSVANPSISFIQRKTFGISAPEVIYTYSTWNLILGIILLLLCITAFSLLYYPGYREIVWSNKYLYSALQIIFLFTSLFYLKDWFRYIDFGTEFINEKMWMLLIVNVLLLSIITLCLFRKIILFLWFYFVRLRKNKEERKQYFDENCWNFYFQISYVLPVVVFIYDQIIYISYHI